MKTFYKTSPSSWSQQKIKAAILLIINWDVFFGGGGGSLAYSHPVLFLANTVSVNFQFSLDGNLNFLVKVTTSSSCDIMITTHKINETKACHTTLLEPQHSIVL